MAAAAKNFSNEPTFDSAAVLIVDSAHRKIIYRGALCKLGNFSSAFRCCFARFGCRGVCVFSVDGAMGGSLTCCLSGIRAQHMKYAKFFPTIGAK